MPEADILITSTAATEPIITFKQMQAALKARKRKPIFAVISPCRAISKPSVADLDDVYLYTIDDLDKVILEGQGNREAAAVEAQSPARRGNLAATPSIERSKEVAPVIAALREQ